MNPAYIFLSAALISAPITLAQTESAEPTTTNEGGTSLEPSPAIAKALNSGKISDLQTEIIRFLQKERDAKSAKELLENQTYTRCLYIHELLKLIGVENVQSIYDKSKADAAFIKTFLKDSQWLYLYLYTGMVAENTPDQLQILSDIWKAEHQSAKFTKYRHLSVAIAGMYHIGPWTEKLNAQESKYTPVKLFQQIAKLHSSGKLDEKFLSLQPWEIHFVLGMNLDEPSYDYLKNYITHESKSQLVNTWEDPTSNYKYFGDQAPDSYWYMSKVYTNTSKSQQSFHWGAQASLDEYLEDPDKAIISYQEALRYTPQHPYYRKKLQRHLQQATHITPLDWYVYAADVAQHYNDNGFAAAKLLADIEQKFLKFITSEMRITWYVKIHELIAGTPYRRGDEVTVLLNEHAESLNSNLEKTTYLSKLLTTYLHHGDGSNFGPVLNWAIQSYANDENCDIFNKAFELSEKTPVIGSNLSSPDNIKEDYSNAIKKLEKENVPSSTLETLRRAAANFEKKHPKN